MSRKTFSVWRTRHMNALMATNLRLASNLKMNVITAFRNRHYLSIIDDGGNDGDGMGDKNEGQTPNICKYEIKDDRKYAAVSEPHHRCGIHWIFHCMKHLFHASSSTDESHSVGNFLFPEKRLGHWHDSDSGLHRNRIMPVAHHKCRLYYIAVEEKSLYLFRNISVGDIIQIRCQAAKLCSPGTFVLISTKWVLTPFCPRRVENIMTERTTELK